MKTPHYVVNSTGTCVLYSLAVILFRDIEFTLFLFCELSRWMLSAFDLKLFGTRYMYLQIFICSIMRQNNKKIYLFAYV